MSERETDGKGGPQPPVNVGFSSAETWRASVFDGEADTTSSSSSDVLHDISSDFLAFSSWADELDAYTAFRPLSD